MVHETEYDNTYNNSYRKASTPLGSELNLSRLAIAI